MVVAGGSSSAASCGACKFLRRKCSDGCIFAPYFSYEQGAAHFAAVHKVFGASNASKLLLQLPVHHRSEAAITISFEAQARMCEPIYGCVAYIFALQQQAARLQEEIDSLTVQLTSTRTETPDPQALLTTFLHQTSQLFLQEENIQHLDPDDFWLDGTGNPSPIREDPRELLPEHQLEAMDGLEHCSILLGDIPSEKLKLREDVHFPFAL